MSSSDINRRPWWLLNRGVVDRYVRDASSLLASGYHSDGVSAALSLLDAAIAISPRHELALELKARCLLHLRRFQDVADMLLHHLPSYKLQISQEPVDYSDDEASSEQGTKLLPSDGEGDGGEIMVKCISLKDLKRKVMASFSRGSEDGEELRWRYLALGQACSHLGLMEDALLLLQAGKRLSAAAFRRQCVRRADDRLPPSEMSESGILSGEPRSVSRLLSHVKQLLRRRAAAIAAADAGAYTEAARLFSKILDSRRGGGPQGFMADCYVRRAAVYTAVGRVADAIADCSRAVVLNSASIRALSMRANLLESLRLLPDCLRDLERLRLLYHAILRDRKLAGPAWKRQPIPYSEVAKDSPALTVKIEELRRRLGNNSADDVDYCLLMGVARRCSRSELERAHLVLSLRHRPDRSARFVDRCEFVDGRDAEAARGQARVAALALYRLVQRGYSTLMASVLDETAAERQRQMAAAVAIARAIPIQIETIFAGDGLDNGGRLPAEMKAAAAISGGFCRDLSAVENPMSPVRFFNTPIPG